MPKPPTSPPTSSSGTTSSDAAIARASKRAALLIEKLLTRLEAGVKAEDEKPSAEWKRLFGTTQSAVVNVQKLVQALAALPDIPMQNSASETPPEVPMSEQELAMLKEWLHSR